MNDEYQCIKKTSKRKLTTLILLVIFVFVILSVSILIAGGLSYVFLNIGILPALSANRSPVILLFILLVSMFICIPLAIIGGNYFLRPLWVLTEATKKVAAGNFDVRVEVGGSSETSRLAANFNKMTAELSSIEMLRNDFISNISHEFKTPVVSIRGFARRLKKSDLTDEQRNEYLDIIIAETERLASLSSNVLLLSKLESTDRVLDKAEYSLDEQLRRSVLLLEPQIQKKRLELEVDLEPTQFIGNEEIMQPLWINLIGNAIKFTTVGGVIGVNLRSDGNEAIVSVSDTGIGMDDEVKKRAFDKFHQGDRSRATEGNGLGLALVKRILELNNGKITIDSVPGEGTCFTVLLPLNEM